MQVDATCVQLRPRSMFEAADLGVRLVQVSARSLLRTALPVYAVCAALCWSLLPLAPWAPSLALWLAKPWLDRTLLFVLSRSLFGQPTTAADLWGAARSVWWQGLLASLSTRRLSPWRAFTQPARQLEGLKGTALRKRVAQLKRGHQGAALQTQHNLDQASEARGDIGVAEGGLDGAQRAALPRHIAREGQRERRDLDGVAQGRA